MPTNRTRRQVRRFTKWTDAHKTHLSCGHDFFGTAFGDTRRDPAWRLEDVLEDMEAAWHVFGPELLEECSKSGCCRPWFWYTLKLRESPRLRMVEDNDVPPTTIKPPWGEPWQGTFHEPALIYLHRTGQLQPGEIERRRTNERTPGIAHTLDYWRRQAEYSPSYADSIRRQPWELAAAHVIYDPDGSRCLLDGDELRAAGPFIARLTESVA